MSSDVPTVNPLVAQAVRETFAAFEVYADWIWCARPRDYIPEERG